MSLIVKPLSCEAINVSDSLVLPACPPRDSNRSMTVPGPLNYHQAVTRWVFER
jgi:hypothetical protein